jgi:ribonuclease P protein subunit RPR2
LTTRPERLGVSIAAERIERLHELARRAAAEGDDDRSRSYVRRARRVAERNRLSLSHQFDRFTCDRCDVYLRPGRNARVRTRSGHVVVTCDCGAQARYPYDTEREPSKAPSKSKR